MDLVTKILLFCNFLIALGLILLLRISGDPVLVIKAEIAWFVIFLIIMYEKYWRKK